MSNNESEQINHLAEAADLLDRGGMLRRQAEQASTVEQAQEHREQAWLMFREAELRIQLAGMQNLRDMTGANVPLQQEMLRRLTEDDDLGLG